MKHTTFQDINNKEIRVQYSSNGNIRIYFGEQKECPCILLNEFQAKILINSINDLLDNED